MNHKGLHHDCIRKDVILNLIVFQMHCSDRFFHRKALWLLSQVNQAYKIQIWQKFLTLGSLCASLCSFVANWQSRWNQWALHWTRLLSFVTYDFAIIMGRRHREQPNMSKYYNMYGECSLLSNKQARQLHMYFSTLHLFMFAGTWCAPRWWKCTALYLQVLRLTFLKLCPCESPLPPIYSSTFV